MTVFTRTPWTWIFLLLVIIIYGIILFLFPELATEVLKNSMKIIFQIALPFFIAFIVIFLINLFIRPAQILRFLGKDCGLMGILISTVSGILSMGPVYAWYPLLKTMHEKGASSFHIANFLSNRAIKPFLFPLMIFYFGWIFTVVFNGLIILSSILTALFVDFFENRFCKAVNFQK